jgi:hypothetical protein
MSRVIRPIYVQQPIGKERIFLRKPFEKGTRDARGVKRALYLDPA